MSNLSDETVKLLDRAADVQEILTTLTGLLTPAINARHHLESAKAYMQEYQEALDEEIGRSLRRSRITGDPAAAPAPVRPSPMSYSP